MFKIIFISLVTFIIYKLWTLLKVPPAIKHIPAVPLHKTIISIFKRMTFAEKRDYLYKDLLDKHGAIRYFFRSKWVVLIGDAFISSEIYNNTAVFPKILKTQAYPNSLSTKLFGDNVVLSNGENWKKFRKCVNPGFKIQFDTTLFSNIVSELIQVIDSKLGNSVDMSHYFRRLTMEVLGVGLMNIKFNSILAENPEFNHHYNNVHQHSNLPIFHIFQGLNNPKNPMLKSAYKSLRFLEKYFEAVLEEKREELKNSDIEPKDILSLMLMSMEKDDKLTDKEIRDNIMIFVTAGHGTTALSLTAAMYFLCKYPEYQDQARREALAIFGKPGNDKKVPISHEQLKRLPFIDSIIKESLRMYPPVAFLPPRVNKNEFSVNGIHIPKHSIILIETFHIQNSINYWQNPSEFNPYRFFENSNSAKSPHPTTSWSPFGAGERMCSGLGFSMMEQRITLALLLLNYELEFSQESKQDSPLDYLCNSTLSSEGVIVNFKQISY
jgi:cytochrome P450